MLTALAAQDPWLVDLTLFLRDHGVSAEAGDALLATRTW